MLQSANNSFTDPPSQTTDMTKIMDYKNYLPKDGTVYYLGQIMNQSDADSFYEDLFSNIDWKHDEVFIYGKSIVTKRKVAWYADFPMKYTYSHTTKIAIPWTETLLVLKKLVERISGETFNSCLLNLYHHGGEGMSWHCDDEPELKKNGTIASLSFGAVRKFQFKHKKTKEKIQLFLEHGSLLLMKETTQQYWLHQLPTSKMVKNPRINLTFRNRIVHQGNE